MSSPSPYLPPEWSAQSAVWAGWPHLRGEWGDTFEAARREIADFLKALSAITPVKIACGSREAYGSAWFAFGEECQTGQITLHTVPAGDIWVRDTGPLFANIGGQVTALQFGFNGWGGKYNMSGDNYTAGGIASAERRPRKGHSFILEGGAIDWDGDGRLLTTKACLLNPNRMSTWDQTSAEHHLKAALGISEIIWIERGLRNDHTDGHIDNIARFIGAGRVVCQKPSGQNDPNAALYDQIFATLRAANLDVVQIPSPGAVLAPDKSPLPASHLNFLISNHHLFLPVYEARFSAEAITVLQAALPEHQIVPVASTQILAGGGALHCMTQQVPKLESTS